MILICTRDALGQSGQGIFVSWMVSFHRSSRNVFSVLLLIFLMPHIPLHLCEEMYTKQFLQTKSVSTITTRCHGSGAVITIHNASIPKLARLIPECTICVSCSYSATIQKALASYWMYKCLLNVVMDMFHPDKKRQQQSNNNKKRTLIKC